ncbi:MAG: hypothetical protein SOV20_08810 [Coriobacteriales bacterium]|nr:hypothetical protein [Coriobacteriaceae bacterium]MDY2723898.1 hypothetical protein [Coriobacteriales bacterium]
MASNVKFVPNYSGYVQLRNSDAVQGVCYGYAYGFAVSAESRAPFRGHYDADVRPGKTRCHARAHTSGTGTYFQELKHHGPLAHSF